MYIKNYPQCAWCGDYIWYLYLDNHEKHCEERPMAFGMDVDAVFAFHPATKVTGPKHDEIREKCRVLAHWIDNNVPASAEQTLAIRKLQETMMFANAAVAIHTPVDYEETPQVNPHSGATWEPGGGPISEDLHPGSRFHDVGHGDTVPHHETPDMDLPDVADKQV